ncbi:MAG TPA: M1 family aminopeptidase, partial [Ferruginibacter sp.]|nr:M1 family aminopeptidase [Ferruginibacter sp.]
ENSTPVNQGAVFISKLLSISSIPVIFISVSILIAMLVQLTNGTAIEAGIYLSLYYYTGYPLILTVLLVLVLQSIIPSKYGGLLIACIVISITSSGIGKMIGVTHPLLRYANSFSKPYNDLNGFGNYSTAFHWQMLLWTCAAICMVMGIEWRRSRNIKSAQKIFFIMAALIFISTAAFIYYNTNIKYNTLSGNALNEWKQQYELKYKPFENYPGPVITRVKTTVDLYPSKQSYNVTGTYTLVNKNQSPLDSILVYFDRNTTMNGIRILHGKKISDDKRFGHHWFVMNKPLLPGDSTEMIFDFSSGWSSFNNHIPFNSIINNGSFIRISNYYPSLGYENNNEISNSIERHKRLMAAQPELKKLEDTIASRNPYDFIHFDAVVSTEGNQYAVGPGHLLKQWFLSNRNYFHYTASDIPFRFALSSARYAIKKDLYNNIPIEIYYHPTHNTNVDKLISNVKKTIEYCEMNFGPYPYNVIRFAEVSGFAEGFSATAYPATIYMKENGGFYNLLEKGNEEDAINQLAGHELSHQWWGNSQISPEYREGGWILTETLAKYTELMIFKNEHGTERMLDIIRQHIDLYLASRSFSKETPLYKTTFETPHIAYNKGMVVMYQLYKLIGEENMNKALHELLLHHRYPNRPPLSTDLLNEIYKASPVAAYGLIDEYFKKIIIYDSRIESVQLEKADGNYEISFEASVKKYSEDGMGKRAGLNAREMEAGILLEDGRQVIGTFRVTGGKMKGTFRVKTKPLKIIIDPSLKTIDAFIKDNEREISLN